MSETQQKPPQDFEPVESASEARGLIAEAAKVHASTLLWVKNQERTLKTYISLISESEQIMYVWVPKGFEPRVLNDDLARMGEKECYFSVSLSRANIFFRTAFKGFDTAGFRFEIPKQIFKVQRRRDLRFPIPDGHVLKVEYPDPLEPATRLTRKVIDISASGMAIQITEAETALYPAGLVLTPLEFTVRGRAISCGGEIRHAKGTKVGIQFVGIKEGDSQHIASYVFEESRKFYSRFI